MANVFGVFEAQAFVVLVVAVIGLATVAMYFDKTPKEFLIAYAFLLLAALCTNLENAFLPDLLNYTEHFVGNLGAGLAFAGAAYVYRKRNIAGQRDGGTDAELDGKPEA